MDADVAQLVREQRLVEAARLASERGDTHNASLIYEQACEWQSAAAEAMRGGATARALELAVYGGDQATAEQALSRLANDAAASETAAVRFAQRGQHAWAARVLEASGRDLDAARAWERAGDGPCAAALLERCGEPADAERVLQAALRREPDAWGVAVSLGALLGRFGRLEAAVRVLQRVPATAAERYQALIHLADAFDQLAFVHSARDARAQLTSLEMPAIPRPDAPIVAAVAPVAAPPAPRTRLFGRYDRVREVASSASARVDVVLGRRVAIKMFAAWEARGSGRDALARFEREVRALRSLDSPNVVPLYDFVRDAPAIVLAWMSGGTLEQMLASQERLAPARAVEIASGILAALGAAHRLGILHRDVKPANVLFDEAGGARLSDFGVAHVSDLSATATAGVFGTLAYMSPEQRAGQPATVRSDLFAVGVMLRQMLTGERPSASEGPQCSPTDAHRGLDPRHDALIARMTAGDTHQRPNDAFEARAMLAALPWPAMPDMTRASPRVETESAARQLADRLEPRPEGTALDQWTGRTIEPIPLTEWSLARARAYALADHPALQTVWRLDAGAGTVWLEALDAKTLDRPLTPEERRQLEGALDALHAAGGVHGHIDARHVLVGPSGVVLRFEANPDPTATADRDRIALARL
jgi:serine/threonine protein kinase